MNKDDTVFLESLASAEPTPGGGSAAAYAGAMGAALVEMVARLTIGKKKYLDVESRMVEISEEAAELRVKLSDAVAEDATAFEAVMQAIRMPKDDDAQKSARQEAIEAATLEAASVPLEVAKMALQTLRLAVEVAQDGNLNAASDAGAAGALASASLHAALMNVQINALALESSAQVETLMGEFERLRLSAGEEHQRLADHLENRASIQL